MNEEKKNNRPKIIEAKDIVYSLLFGLASSFFLIFVIKNPYIEEFSRLAFLDIFVLWLPVIFLAIFLFIILLTGFLAKFYPTIYQFGKFANIGILNLSVDFGILNLLVGLTGITGGMGIAPLNALPFLFTNINSYFWNKRWAFNHWGKIEKKEFLRFLLVSGIGIGINTGIVVVGTGLPAPLAGFSAGAWVNVVKVLATLISMIWNFLGYKFMVFYGKK